MRRGWTLIELLVSTAVLGGILLFSATLLASTQRASRTVSSRAALSLPRVEALATLRQTLDRIVWSTRPTLSGDDKTLEDDSSLHFVCGPARELLPGVAGLAGDAMFYQSLNGAGQIECGGLFVQFGDDAATRPAFLNDRTPLRCCFRLMQWRQPAAEGRLFATASDGRQTHDRLTSREELHRWFREDITAGRNCHIIAEQVLALLIVHPQGGTLYDSRRHQWDASSAASVLSRHRLPSPLSLRLITTSPHAWRRAAGTDGQALASEWINLVANPPPALPSSATFTPAPALITWLERHRLEHLVVSLDR